MLLRGAVSAAGAAAILGSTANRAAAKISQAAVAYQPQPNADKRCDRCVQFQPPNACKIIDGTISPQGWCKVFVPAPR
jgi:High potential iron-sulfur protein